MVEENFVILMRIKIGLLYTYLLSEIIYDIDPGQLCASNEVGRQNGHSFRELTLILGNG